MEPLSYKNKKVLIMGLGLLGGGVATTRWFVRNSARVTVTDIRSKKILTPSIRALGILAKKVTFVLGKHRVSDFKNNDFIIVNPGVPRENTFLRIAREAGKIITNDAKIFCETVENPIIGVTGTRGKTTTTNWIAHFLRAKFQNVIAAGNTPEMPLLGLLPHFTHDIKTPAVLELSSWQLEFLDNAHRAPHVAIITNLYPDHLNRYRGMRDYASAKANIFKNQDVNDIVILNADNVWTKFFLAQKPRAHIYFFSLRKLPRDMQGIYVYRNTICYRDAQKEYVLLSGKKFADIMTLGAHNIANLFPAMLASYMHEISWKDIIDHITSLPHIPYREEVIFRTKKLCVVNDSAGTSPDATIAALQRFSNQNTILITGGTDKKLEFQELAHTIMRHIPPHHLFLLNGSATQKLLRALQKIRYFKNISPQIYEDLNILLQAIHVNIKKIPTTILFSPGAASFEKFKNEFDRGEKFTVYSKQIFNKK